MAKCTCCGKETDNTVWESNIGKFAPLCVECKETKFAKCSVCGQNFYKEELKNGKCQCCGD